MSGATLPSRTDPETLLEVCRILEPAGGADVEWISETLGIGVRQVRETVDYGVKLGFLATVGETIENASGAAIATAKDRGRDVAPIAFRRAVEHYRPYREALVTLFREDRSEPVLGEPCLTRETISTTLGHVTGTDVTDREALLFTRTMAAAGLGTFLHGRKGYSTRVQLSDEFRPFAEWLSGSRSNEAGGTGRRSTHRRETRGSKTVTVSVELEVTDEPDEELVGLMRELSAVLDGSRR